MSIKRKMSLLAVFAVIILLTAAHAQSDRRRAATSRPDAPTAVTPTVEDFSTKQIEHYLGDAGIAFIRPGLQITVESIEIPADRKPVVELFMKDNFGNPVDRLGMATPGNVSASFILAWYNPDNREFVPYTTRTQRSPNGNSAVQASSDSGGSWTNFEMGHYQYKFGTTLPADYPASMTHTLGIYAEREIAIEEFHIDKQYFDNVLEDFVPAGGAVTTMWDKISDQSCNNCHDQLAFHGGSRRDVKLCVLCHTEGIVDPDSGNSVDMEIMIHKIHMGANLPSVEAGTPYQIIGYRQSVHDYSEVVFPQDIRNCANCHYGRSDNAAPSQSELWFTEPSTDACGSCHDDVNFVTGENHPAGPAENGTCTTCHQPDGAEFGPSIMGAHTVPEKSTQLPGLNYEIMNVMDVMPGMAPTVMVRVTNDAGEAVDGTAIDQFRMRYAGPTTDYTIFSQGGTATFDAATGMTQFVFDDPLPEDASGTFAFSGDVYDFVDISQPATTDTIRVRDSAFNNVAYAAVGGGSATPRREIADIEVCNVCHDRLALHGGQRLNVEDCVSCHNPTATDEAVRPASEGAPRSIAFKFMIHRIHAGEELTRDFTVYGYRSSVHNYNEVVFPARLSNCDKCHVGGSQQLPLPATAAPVVTPREFFSPLGPAAAGCLGCHDTKDAAAHAFLNTAMFPGSTDPAESCGVCHGEGADWSVDRVHAE